MAESYHWKRPRYRKMLLLDHAQSNILFLKFHFRSKCLLSVCKLQDFREVYIFLNLLAINLLVTSFSFSEKAKFQNFFCQPCPQGYLFGGSAASQSGCLGSLAFNQRVHVAWRLPVLLSNLLSRGVK